MLVRKLSSDVVFNMANLEGNPFTYPEVQTLLEGITIGGHKVSDEHSVELNINIYNNTNFTFITCNKAREMLRECAN